MQLSSHLLILSLSVEGASLGSHWDLILLLALFCFQGYLVGFIWETASCLKLVQGRQNTPLIIHTIAAFSGLCGLWNVWLSAWSWCVLRCWGWSDAVVLYNFFKDRCSVKPKIQALASVSNNPARPLTFSATCFLKDWICSATAQEGAHPFNPLSCHRPKAAFICFQDCFDLTKAKK